MSLDLLLQRNSASLLTEPAPSDEVLNKMFTAAMRAPDHGNLKPWRFLVIAGDRRVDLGELFAVAALERMGNLTPEQTEKFVSQPMRSPMIIVVICSPVDHPKIPLIEQQNAAACAAFSLLLAAEAEGFAGIWRTGDNAFDQTVAHGLGLSADEEITGYIYLGTRKGPAKSLPEINPMDYVKIW